VFVLLLVVCKALLDAPISRHWELVEQRTGPRAPPASPGYHLALKVVQAGVGGALHRQDISTVVTTQGSSGEGLGEIG